MHFNSPNSQPIVHWTIDSGFKVPFQSNTLFKGTITKSNSYLDKVIQFAYDMAFGNNARAARGQGGYTRKNGEIFCNQFQGKLAEVIVYEYLTNKGINCTQPDFKCYPKGKWDNFDLKVNNNKVNEKLLSIKSSTDKANLLLLETSDYDTQGRYLHTQNGVAPKAYDFHILVRISPDIKKQRLPNVKYKIKDLYSFKLVDIKNLINGINWEYDIPGWIDNSTFIQAISQSNIIHQGDLLGTTTLMDVDNYFIMTYDLEPINKIIPLLL